MELLYEPQSLLAGQLNNSFNQIDNCEIVRPTWKGNKTYGDTFFIKKRKSIVESGKNVPAGDIVDAMTIEGVEYLLIHNGGNVLLAYDDGVNYTQIGASYTKGDTTPIKLVKGQSGRGEMDTGIVTGDPFYDMNFAGAWNIATNYVKDNIVTHAAVTYISLRANVGVTPGTSPDDWIVYSTDNSGYVKTDPSTIIFNDVFVGGYLKLKLKKASIRDIVDISSNRKFILFTNDDSNLQGVTSEIHYTETSYIDWTGATQNLPLDEVYVYIRGTNELGTTPYIGESVNVCNDVGTIPIVAEDTRVISYNIQKTLGVISGATNIVLYEAEDGDKIVDLAEFYGVLFVLTKRRLAFTAILLNSNINFYPLDVINNIVSLDRIVPFGKMLVGFGDVNAVVTKIIGTDGTEAFVYTDLVYNNKLYGKYSVLSHLGSLYILQDDEQFLQVDIVSQNGVDYEVKTVNVITNVRGMFDFIVGDIYMCVHGKDVYVLDIGGHGTYYYKYNTEYGHWHKGDYLTRFYKIGSYLYGDGLYEFGDNYFDNVSDYRDQIVGFDFGGDNLWQLKEVCIVKIIFGLNEKIIDYTLEVDYEIGGIAFKKIIDLNNYPINIEIVGGGGGLGDSNLATTLLGNGNPQTTTTLGSFISVTVGLGITASVFNFKIKSKENGFIYGGSVIGYMNKIPTVTEFNYKH